MSLPIEGQEFLENLRGLVRFWTDVQDHGPEPRTTKRLLEGFMHSVLSEIDGVGSGEPIDLVQGGKVINGDQMLHEHWYPKVRR